MKKAQQLRISNARLTSERFFQNGKLEVNMKLDR